MMLRYLILLSFLMISVPVRSQTITIADARALPVGSTVTVSGIVTSGAEFGTIRYIQDGTGGIALFSASLSSLQRGDDVTVTGTTIEFQNLLEISNVTSWTVNSSGNSLPSPLILSPNQLGESNESMLVRINNATISATGNFQGNTTYNFTANGQPGVIYIRSSNPLVGQPIPAGSIILYGVISQYGSQYQVLPRDANDLVNASIISITREPEPENITTTGFNISWETSVAGNAFVRYGFTPALELGTLTGPSSSSNPSISISGGSPSQVIYAQCYSISGSDTAFSGIKPFITASNSTGQIKVYFNRPVDNSVASPPSNNAVYLTTAFDDTIKAYIDRAEQTLDIAIYSIDDNGASQIAQAINDAHGRGVRVRIITEGGNVNSGLQLLNAAIPVLESPTQAFYYGLMHNKFIVTDALHPDALKPVVMTGSTNWTSGQLNTDRNNLVFVQDQSLAKVYTMEFEEMWGGSGNLPDTTVSRFGPDKTDNTPHILNIGGRKVESYFSPSDNVNSQIIRSAGTANHELYFATMVFTRTDIAYAMEERIVNHGVYGAGIINDTSNGSGNSFLIMQSAMGVNMIEFDHVSQPGILHHKYMIIDQGYSGSDPFVLTGSHNWSTSATQRNDENTIIIHDPLIANQFYQEFRDLFNSSGGALSVNDQEAGAGTAFLYPNPSAGEFSLLVNGCEGQKVSVAIYDLSGKMLKEIFNGIIGTDEAVLRSETGSLSAGVYFIRLTTPGSVQTLRLIVQ